MKTYDPKQLQEFVMSVPKKERQEGKKRYAQKQLDEEVADVQEKLGMAKGLVKRGADSDMVDDFVADSVDDSMDKIKKLKAQIDNITSGKDLTVDQETRDMARAVHIKEVVPASDLVVTGNNRYKMVCPFHDDKTPSCVLYDAPKGYYCFGCNAGGDSIDFVMKYFDVGFIRAVDRLING